MSKAVFPILSLLILLVVCPAEAQQSFTLPDVSKMKELTTQWSDHASEVPGKETKMEFYSTPDGLIYTIYSYKGRTLGFSVHSNRDVQKTYRLFLDAVGNRLFQEVNPGTQWQIPQWAR
jgi:hypothetical protein